MTEIQTSIEIAASPERVWQIITDFARFAEWNPFIDRASGNPVVGQRIEVHLQPPGGRALTLRPLVLTADPQRELSWIGRVGLPGIFDGEHHLVIAPLGADRVRFTQSETFSGLLVPIFMSAAARRATERGFAEMNQALKRRAEQQVGA